MGMMGHHCDKQNNNNIIKLNIESACYPSVTVASKNSGKKLYSFLLTSGYTSTQGVAWYCA